MRYCASGIISQEIFNQWILWHGCNISGNPQPWHIVDLCNILDLLILVIFLIESDLLQFNLMNQIIQNYQINKINQVNLAHHRTDFGLVLFITINKTNKHKCYSKFEFQNGIVEVPHKRRPCSNKSANNLNCNSYKCAW